MPDHKVTVTFNPPDQSSWSFDPKTTPVKNKGTITLEAASGSTWTFTGAVGGIPSTWQTSLTAGNTKITIDDPNDSPATNYTFTVTVTNANGTWTSPSTGGPAGDTGVPPVIENSGTGNMPGKDKKG